MKLGHLRCHHYTAVHRSRFKTPHSHQLLPSLGTQNQQDCEGAEGATAVASSTLQPL